ncbi:YhgE/Pip domain-containing protein [Clostridium homopropionicum]|uniref:YhgE/Pip domain-containing protein n=1 Tax=Clostridium homopropionicum TaxID=36844 RepID=UPI00068E0054|nr:YhgE/Pip domain-containing protein [Clostridium homopropionicum]
MKFLKIAGRDIASIFRNRFIRISVTAIIIVPLLYSLLYLAAFWDPYSKLKEMPVAVVNLDKGSIKDSKEVNYGKDIEDGLKENEDLGFKFISNLENAKKGLEGKEFYAVFVIPEDFSKKITDVEDGKLEKASIDYIANEKKNFLAAQINNKVALELKDKVIKSISEEFTKVTFNNLYEIKDGMNKAADGSSQITDGVSQLKSNVPEMEKGVGKLYEGSTDLNNGLLQLKSNVLLLGNGIGQLKSKVDKASAEFNKHPELKGIVNDKDINGARTLIQDANVLKDADTSALEMLPALATAENLGLINKTTNDLLAIDMNKTKALMNTPGMDKLTDSKNMENMSKLMKDASSLKNLDANKIIPLMSLLQQSDKLRGIMDESTKLTQIDLNSVNNFIEAQKLSSEKFIASSSQLNAHKQELEMAIKTNPNLTDTQVQQMVGLIEEYNTLTTETSKNMQSSALVINNMSKNISELSNLQKDLKDNAAVIEGVKNALSEENVAYLKSALPQLIQVKQELDANSDTLNSVSGLLKTLEGTDIKASLGKIEALQKDIAYAKPMLEALEKNMTPEQLASVKNSPQLINQLLKMKKDLNDNEKILEVTENALQDNNIAMAKGLISSIPELRGGIDKLYSASNELIYGVNALANGSSQLNGGLKELNGKLPELESGVNKLYDGSKELSDKLADGSNDLNDKLKVSSDSMGDFVSEPLLLKEAPINKVPNYGTGFTPYFIPLSLWVGALMMFFIITDKVDEDLDAKPASIVIGKFLSYGFIGVLQALLASVVVLMLGLRPANIPLYILFNVFLSFVFIAIIQSLVFLLGQAGRLLAIVLLILQLTSSGGTFPLEVVPKFFKVLNPIMPFTYATGGLREIISGVDYSALTYNIVVLAVIMIIFLIISVIMKGHADKIQEKIREKREVVA